MRAYCLVIRDTHGREHYVNPTTVAAVSITPAADPAAVEARVVTTATDPSTGRPLVIVARGAEALALRTALRCRAGLAEEALTAPPTSSGARLA